MSSLRRGVVSPAVSHHTPVMHRHQSHASPAGDYLSPSTRHHASLAALHSMASTTAALSPSIMNDDEREKRERRRSKVVELQQRTMSSPATPSDRRRSANLGGLNNTQLADHYANCIKLSAENKINAKNAFGLHLIDYMSDLLKKKDMSNFQVASSTLDASAKIYAGRVDAIHTETYKVLSGLGRGHSAPQKQDGEEGGDEENQAPAAGHEPKPKRARKSNTIETNLKNLNVAKFDLEFEVDPLFHKTSASFDEGGTGGLLLNHLQCLSDTSELVLDSSTVVYGTEDDLTPSQSTSSKLSVDLREFKEMYSRLDLESLHVCPAFSEFEFTNWNNSGEDTFTTMFNRMARSSHAFDLEAEPEPLPSSQDDLDPGDVFATQEGFEPLGGGDDDDDDDNDAASDAANSSDQSIRLGDGKEAQIVQHAIKDFKSGTIGNLIQVLASEPSDYSYFNNKLLRTWAGPEHWKLKPTSKDDATSAQGDKQKKGKDKKEALVLRYDDEADFDASFKQTRAATMLTKATLDRYSKTQTTLPEDLHYDSDKLVKPFLKPKVMVTRQKQSAEDVDGAVENYDFDNANDRDNFCPGVEDDDDVDDNDNSGGLGFDFTSNDATQSQDPTASQSSFVATENINNTLMSADNLVSQPKKVAKIDIAYAKAAKKMDVKRLKASMWQFLTKPAPGSGDTTTSTDSDKENKTEDAGSSSSGEVSPQVAAGQHSFQTLVETLPQRVSKTMADNLSVPIAFVCLLHLANEKKLKITSDETMADLTISQG